MLQWEIRKERRSKNERPLPAFLVGLVFPSFLSFPTFGAWISDICGGGKYAVFAVVRNKACMFSFVPSTDSKRGYPFDFRPKFFLGQFPIFFAIIRGKHYVSSNYNLVIGVIMYELSSPMHVGSWCFMFHVKSSPHHVLCLCDWHDDPEYLRLFIPSDERVRTSLRHHVNYTEANAWTGLACPPSEPIAKQKLPRLFLPPFPFLVLKFLKILQEILLYY